MVPLLPPPVRRRCPRARQAAVAILLAPGRKGTEALFLKRATHPKDPWSGQIGLPGGRRDPGDGCLLDTVIRETAEETGVRLERSALLGELDDMLPRDRGLPPIMIRPFVFTLDRKPRIRVCSESKYSFWAPLESLLASEAERTIRHRGSMRKVPAFRHGRRIIWGITYRILRPLLTLYTQ